MSKTIEAVRWWYQNADPTATAAYILTGLLFFLTPLLVLGMNAEAVVYLGCGMIAGKYFIFAILEAVNDEF